MVPDENRTRPDLLELVTEVVGIPGRPTSQRKCGWTESPRRCCWNREKTSLEICRRNASPQSPKSTAKRGGQLGGSRIVTLRLTSKPVESSIRFGARRGVGRRFFLYAFQAIAAYRLFEPCQAAATDIERATLASGSLRKHEGEANGLDLVRCVVLRGHQADPHQFVAGVEPGVFAPPVGRDFVQLVEHRDVVAGASVLRRSTRESVERMSLGWVVASDAVGRQLAMGQDPSCAFEVRGRSRGPDQDRAGKS